MTKPLFRLLLAPIFISLFVGRGPDTWACPAAAEKLVVSVSAPLSDRTAGGCQAGGGGVCVAFARQAVFNQNIKVLPEFGRFYQNNTFPTVPAGYEGRVESYPFFGVKVEKGSGLTADIAHVMDYAATGRGNSINFDVGSVNIEVALRIKQLTAAFVKEPTNRALKRQLLDLQNERFTSREGLWTEWELSRMAYFEYLGLPNVRIYKNGKLLSPEEKQALVEQLSK